MPGHAGILHPFGDHLQIKVLAKLDHGGDDLGRAGVGGHGADEIAVDLQGVEGQPRQIGERREAGAEVVQGQGRASLAQVAQDHRGPVRIAHDVALGHLQLEGARRQAGVAQDLDDVGNEVRAVDLAGGQVHRHGQLAGRPVGVAPDGELAGGLAHHVGAERAHQAHLFAERQELVGRQQATPGMTPADQGLEARQRAGGEAHDRLVVGHQLAPADGAAQIALQGQTRKAVAFQASAIGRRPAPAAGLGRLYGKLGPTQQLGGLRRLVAALGPHRAHREGWMDVEARHTKGPLQSVAQDLAGRRVAHRRQHAEFVFADAGQQHAWPEGGGQP